MRVRPAGIIVATAVNAALLLGACQLFFPTTVEPDPYNDLSTKANWETVTLDAGYTSSIGNNVWAGGTFDGRYVYLASFGTSAVRYDTHADFTSEKSWEGFNTVELDDAGSSLFYGAAFDGRYVYFVPNNYDLPGHLVFTQYDTHGSFTDRASWKPFDGTRNLHPAAQPYAGSVFDGRFLYFVPQITGTLAQYDTQATFDDPASWHAFDMTKVNPAASGMTGAVFDGHYIYFVPSQNNATPAEGGFISGTPDGIAIRYDSRKPLDDLKAWEAFDLAKHVDPNAGGFAGGAFDGRYVYFVPYISTNGLVTRLDTQGDFADAGSWSTFVANNVNPQANGMIGGGFDGRYIYLVPYSNVNIDGVVARYDTTASFGATGSWSAYDMTQLSDAAIGFTGSVFDGQYMYFVPDWYTTVVRFNARTPPATPKLPAFFGSFL